MPDAAFVTRRALEPKHRIERHVLLALEVIDAIEQTIVTRGLVVTANGLTRRPIISGSGRFVWLQEADRWPTEIAIVSTDGRFEPTVVTLSKPIDVTKVEPAKRLVRVQLRPTATYPLADVTAVRGRLLEQATDPSVAPVPVVGARLQFAWFDDTAQVWVPQPSTAAEGGQTSAHGEFATFLRVPSKAKPDVVKGQLKVRLQFTRGVVPETRATPDTFAFVPEPSANGRVPEGQALGADLAVGWAELSPV